MIDKIVSIGSVGTFHDFRSAGDTAFRQLTLISAENGRGKSTLAAILRSMGSGAVERLLERRTLGHGTGTPAVHVRFGGSDVKHTDGRWNRHCPDIVVFDPVFVAENVHAGDAVDHEHKKNLYQFAVGAPGVELAKRVTELDTEIRQAHRDLQSLEGEIQRHVEGGVQLAAFIALPRVADLEQELSSASAQLAAAEAQGQLASKPGPTPLPMPTPGWAELETVLAATLSDVSASAAAMVAEHVDAHLGPGGERWLGQGRAYADGGRCPFCGRSTQGVSLVQAYQVYFSQAYADLKRSVADERSRVSSALSEGQLERIRTNVVENQARVAFWESYMDMARPQISIDPVIEALEDARDHLLEVLDRKLSAPLESVSAADASHALRERADAATDTIGAYNDSVKAANAAIAAKKTELGTLDLVGLRERVSLLKATRARFRDEVDALCQKHAGGQAAKAKLQEQKERTRRQLRDDTASLIGEYQEDMNQYLRDFGAGFEIARVKESHVGGKPNLEYRIVINGEHVDVRPPAGASPTPSFRSTLSSGDRSTLAFSFFLAALRRDPRLSDKVVVLDDPISSLDSNRRACTRYQIGRLAREARQVVVLSHDPYFLRMIWEEAPKTDVKTLRITTTPKGSAIGEWNIERATQGEYFDNYFALVEYLESGPAGRDLRAVARCIRPLLEGNLRLAFPRRFQRGHWLGEMLDMVRKAQPGDPEAVLKPFLNDLSDINDYSKKYHHDQTQNPDQSPISEAELAAYVRRTIAVLHHVLTPAGRSPSASSPP